jgi:hypothetical protein
MLSFCSDELDDMNLIDDGVKKRGKNQNEEERLKQQQQQQKRKRKVGKDQVLEVLNQRQEKNVRWNPMSVKR